MSPHINFQHDIVKRKMTNAEIPKDGNGNVLPHNRIPSLKEAPHNFFWKVLHKGR